MLYATIHDGLFSYCAFSKNKSGDLTDKNNYRPIALSGIASKVFEHIIILRLEKYLWTNDNQFGFKSGHSTDLCIYALSEFIKYFKSSSTSVYVAFLDASKAFNIISHWTLFRKLIDRKISIYLVKILCDWYQHQIMSVRWGCSISNRFNVTNGVRQGGVLSPKLFNVYIDGLSNILNNCTTGGFLGGKRINHMLYADDLCIVSLSSQDYRTSYRSVIKIELVTLLHLMLRNLFACFSKVALTNIVIIQMYT